MSLRPATTTLKALFADALSKLAPLTVGPSFAPYTRVVKIAHYCSAQNRSFAKIAVAYELGSTIQQALPSTERHPAMHSAHRCITGRRFSMRSSRT